MDELLSVNAADRPGLGGTSTVIACAPFTVWPDPKISCACPLQKGVWSNDRPCIESR